VVGKAPVAGGRDCHHGCQTQGFSREDRQAPTVGYAVLPKRIVSLARFSSFRRDQCKRIDRRRFCKLIA
jgi:hypothetical protein